MAAIIAANDCLPLGHDGLAACRGAPKPYDAGYHIPDLSHSNLRVSDDQECAFLRSALGMTQATISTHMRHLEERLGLRLCSRGRSGFLLSGEGRLVYDAALELFGSLEKLQSRIGEAQGELTGNLSFGTVDAMITNRGRNLQVRLRHSTAKPRISARSRSFPKCRNSIAPRGIRCSTRPTER